MEEVFKSFGNPLPINDDAGDNEQRRIDILTDLNRFTHYAVHETFVMIRTPLARCLMERREVKGAPMVGFVYKAHTQSQSYAFWMNAASVTNIGQMLRDNAGKRISWDDMMKEYRG